MGEYEHKLKSIRDSGSVAALVLVFVAALLSVSPVQAQVATGELGSDFSGPSPRTKNDITFGRKDRDLVFSFIFPQGYDAVHIRWSGPTRPEIQEEYRIGNRGQDTVCSYTIHHVIAQQFYMFKVQAVKKNDDFIGKDSLGPWITRGVMAGRPPQPKTSPPVLPPLKAPQHVVAMRKSDADVNVSWTVDGQADWYVVERRIPAAFPDGLGSTQWAPACSPLKKGTGNLLAHCPVQPGGLKNIFRVIAYDSQMQSFSAPVSELTSRIARKSDAGLSGTRLSPLLKK
jgi:hypothetical protein